MTAINPGFVGLLPGTDKQGTKPRRAHLIASVHWPQGVRPEEYDGCPIECICGWAGVVGEWQAHRTGVTA